jgi:hypothetical protein
VTGRILNFAVFLAMFQLCCTLLACVCMSALLLLHAVMSLHAAATPSASQHTLACTDAMSDQAECCSATLSCSSATDRILMHYSGGLCLHGWLAGAVALARRQADLPSCSAAQPGIPASRYCRVRLPLHPNPPVLACLPPALANSVHPPATRPCQLCSSACCPSPLPLLTDQLVPVIDTPSGLFETARVIASVRCMPAGSHVQRWQESQAALN